MYISHAISPPVASNILLTWYSYYNYSTNIDTLFLKPIFWLSLVWLWLPFLSKISPEYHMTLSFPVSLGACWLWLFLELLMYLMTLIVLRRQLRYLMKHFPVGICLAVSMYMAISVTSHHNASSPNWHWLWTLGCGSDCQSPPFWSDLFSPSCPLLFRRKPP